MKNAFVSLINRLNTAEERINKLKDRSIEITDSETQRKKEWKIKNPQLSIQELKGNIKWSNICVTEIPEVWMGQRKCEKKCDWEFSKNFNKRNL